MTDKIKVELTGQTSIRAGTATCGGHTEKVPVLAEGKDEHGTVRVCEQCLQAGDIDARLEKTAAHLDAQAALTRKLIGRLQVPSYAEWKAACAAHEEEWVRQNTDFANSAEFDAHFKKLAAASEPLPF